MKMEERDRLIREAGYAEGERHKLISQIEKKLARGKTAEEIASELEEEIPVIEKLIQEIGESK